MSNRLSRVWFFVTDWFPIYLIAKNIPLKSSLLAVWVPFIASDLGNFLVAPHPAIRSSGDGLLARRGKP